MQGYIIFGAVLIAAGIIIIAVATLVIQQKIKKLKMESGDINDLS